MSSPGSFSTRSLTIPVLASTVALLGGLLAPVSVAVADELAADAAVHVVGTLVVIQAEETPSPVVSPQGATDADDTLAAHVLLADGSSVPIDGYLIPTDAASGAPVDVVAAPSAEVFADAGIAASGTVAADSAEGQQIVEAAVVADDPLTVVAGEIGAVEVQAAAAAHTIDVAVVSNGSTATAASTDAYVKAVLAKVGKFWTEQSAGAVPAITLTSIKRYSSTKGCGTQDSTIALWDEAAKKFGHAGGADDYVGAGTKHLFVISPPSCATSFNGLGSIGNGVGNGGVVWAAFDGGDGSGDELTLAHEIGHNFSLHHANVQQCTSPDTDAKIVGTSYGTSSCFEDPYADLYDVMGMSFVVNDGTTLHGNDNTPALNAISKLRLGLISATDAPTLTAAATPSTTSYAITGASALSGRRALKIIDPVSQERYYVEYRNAQGRDAGSLYSRFANPPAHWSISAMGPGIRVLKSGPGGSTSVVLPDATASGPRLAFVAGRSFTSRTKGLKVTVSSLTTSAATVSVTLTPPVLAFAGTNPPTISGNRQVGRTLTAVAGSGWTPAPTTMTYKWMRNGAAISGATSAAYVPVAADVGTLTTVAVTGTRSGYTTRTWTSTGTVKTVSEAAFAGEKLPVVTGSRAVGNALTVTPDGGWTPAPTSYTYRWYRGSTVISGATGSSYTQKPDDIGAIVTASVTAVRDGVESRSYRSATAAKTTGAFTGSAVPTVSGEPFVARTLTAKPSTAWVPTPTSYTYQWYRNGTAIARATAKTYVVATADKGSKLTVRVTAVKSGVTSRSGVSAATATIASLKSFTGTALPTVKGTRTVGSTLSALSGSDWSPKTTGTTYRYAWYRGSTPISGATAKTYTQVSADVGQVIRVKMSAMRYGYKTKSAISSATAAKTVR
ncbi:MULTISPECIES: hypothetical protein [unclassified Leifsonia]|uniref:hypothetical protein n=1 Tax=unclassified Leifsonia TaxID=2663824 RepID=UPI0006F7761B|nr:MULTISPECIES: hypothetical protein [unclassified Leifsonia]KQX07572.1 hypothetical protein ASC59_07470 [Leifsonia sp. Root1293]KRA11854.1 hypothetical protein ASD61_07470 [Leifsonia sp. Root60]